MNKSVLEMSEENIITIHAFRQRGRERKKKVNNSPLI